MRRRGVTFGRLQFRHRRGYARGLDGAAMCSCCGDTSPERGGVAVSDGGVSLRVAYCARSRRLMCGSIAAHCARSRRLMRFYCRVLRSITPVDAVLLECFASDHACLFSFVRKRETACGMLHSYSAVGRDRHLYVLMTLCGYQTLLVHFGLVRFFMAIPTEYEGTRGTESAARCRTLLRKPLGLAAFSAGSTLGLRAPDCAKETSLPGLSSFDSRRGCALRGEQSAYHAAFG